LSLVSIIITTFNKASLAIETLKSIVAQTYSIRDCLGNYNGYLKTSNYLKGNLEK